MKQRGLFEEPESGATKAGEGLEDYAFLYTGTEKGNNSGIKFMMTLEDAQTWCSSDLSQGTLNGTRWAYFFTSVKNFTECHWGTQKPKIDLRKCVDNGSWDERIASTGAVKIDFKETKRILEGFGIEVLIP